ncbi:host specificity J domain protein [Escherichia coli DEC4C]|nr:host specificity J domain protein [Escherichia coli DEC4C]
MGKSAFVEVSGQPSNDGEGYLEFFREKIGKLHLAQGLWELIDNSQLADEMAEMKTTNHGNPSMKSHRRSVKRWRTRAPLYSRYSACRRTQMMTWLRCTC